MSTESSPEPAEAGAAPFRSSTELLSVASSLLKDYVAHLAHTTEANDAPEFLTKIAIFIERGREAGVFIDNDDERGRVEATLDYWARRLQYAGGEFPETNLAAYDPQRAPVLGEDRCPYLGLDAFKEADSHRFFGREQLIRELLERLKEHRLLIVVGPSASGKSSAIMGGLLPKLREGALPGSAEWHYYPPIVPGSNPLLSLTQLIQSDHSAAPEHHVATLLQKPGYLAAQINQADGGSAVVVVDQFEEVFTLCQDRQVHQSFIDNLLVLTMAKTARHIVILILRSEFESSIALAHQLHQRFEQAQVRVMPPLASELRDIIEKPAGSELKFDEGLVEELLRDILGEPAGLPLLQFTLLKLWENRVRNQITREAYRRLGGGRLALARSADTFYQGLNPEERATAHHMLLRMVRLEPGLEFTSQRVLRSVLYPAKTPEHDKARELTDRVLAELIQAHLARQIPGDPTNDAQVELAHEALVRDKARELTDRVLVKLIQARLARQIPGDTTNDAQVELAHEALVRNWPLLVKWLEDERELRRHRQRLTDNVTYWQTHNQDSALLLRGPLLDEALRLPIEALNDQEKEFLRASLVVKEKAEQEKEAAHRREIEHAAEQVAASKRIQMLTTGLAIMSVIAIGAMLGYLITNLQKQETISALPTQANAGAAAGVTLTAAASQIAELQVRSDLAKTQLAAAQATQTSVVAGTTAEARSTAQAQATAAQATINAALSTSAAIDASWSTAVAQATAAQAAVQVAVVNGLIDSTQVQVLQSTAEAAQYVDVTSTAAQAIAVTSQALDDQASAIPMTAAAIRGTTESGAAVTLIALGGTVEAAQAVAATAQTAAAQAGQTQIAAEAGAQAALQTVVVIQATATALISTTIPTITPSVITPTVSITTPTTVGITPTVPITTPTTIATSIGEIEPTDAPSLQEQPTAAAEPTSPSSTPTSTVTSVSTSTLLIQRAPTPALVAPAQSMSALSRVVPLQSELLQAFRYPQAGQSRSLPPHTDAPAGSPRRRPLLVRRGSASLFSPG